MPLARLGPAYKRLIAVLDFLLKSLRESASVSRTLERSVLSLSDVCAIVWTASSASSQLPCSQNRRFAEVLTTNESIS